VCPPRPPASFPNILDRSIVFKPAPQRPPPRRAGSSRARRAGADAAEFRPERHLPSDPGAAGRHRLAWMPFAAGPRVCLAANFALNEALIAVASLMQARAPPARAPHAASPSAPCPRGWARC
jgi:cytochrome P450